MANYSMLGVIAPRHAMHKQVKRIVPYYTNRSEFSIISPRQKFLYQLIGNA